MSSDHKEYEETIKYLKDLMDEVQNWNGERVKFSHDVPSHTSIRIPSERKEFLKRKRKFEHSDH